MKLSIQNVVEALLRGPGPDGPKFELSVTSVFYIIRDLIWCSLLTIVYVVLSIVEKFVAKPEKDVSGQVIVITGAGNGIGRELAIKLSKLGSTVVCVDINKDTCEETCSMLLGPGKHSFYACDVGKPHDVKAMAEKIVARHGTVDIVIHGAAIIAAQSILSADEEFLNKFMNVNLMSSFWMVRAFLPHLSEKRKGHFVFICSLSAIFALGNASAYSTSKAGMLGFVNSMIREFQMKPETANIKVTAVLPSFINTRPDHLDLVKTRFPTDIALRTKEGARQIIVGIRREYERFVVPNIRTSYIIAYMFRALPANAFNIWREVFAIDADIPDGVPFVPQWSPVDKKVEKKIAT